jgi:hypothetical protein
MIWDSHLELRRDPRCLLDEASAEEPGHRQRAWVRTARGVVIEVRF